MVTRPLAIIEANGSLLFSASKSIFRRIDGPSPSYALVHDLDDLNAGNVVSAVGGIRGLTPIASPTGSGQSLLFVWAPDGHSKGCVMRLDPDSKGSYTRIQEVCLDKLVSQYLNGNPVYFMISGYNNFLSVKDPASQETNYLIGIEAWISGKRFMTTQRTQGGGYYAGALYAIRDSKGRYLINEVNGRISSSNPPLVATRCYALSPFAADHGEVVYFGGYDCNFSPCSDTAWIFRTSLVNALRGSESKQ